MFEATIARAKAAALVAVVLGLGVPVVQAQPVQTWTLQSVEQRALEASPRIRSATAALEAAKSFSAFGTMPVVGNPTIALRALVGKPDQSAATYGAVVGLPFDLSGKRRAWRGEANAAIAEAEAFLEVARNEVRATAREAYVLLATGELAQTVAEQSAENAQGVLSRIQARFDAKAATLLDVALAEREYGEARADTARARKDVINAQADLRQVLDLAATDAVRVEPLAAPKLPDGLSVEEVVRRALERRREMAAYEGGIKRLERADTRLRKQAIAPVVIAAEGEAQGNDNTQKSVGASVAFELPVVLRNQGERAVAKGQAGVLMVEREIAEHTVAREAAVSLQRLEASLAELSALEEQASSAADRALAMTNEMLEAGAVDYFYLLTARRSAFQLRARRVNSLRDAWLSRIALERAVGGLEEAP